jgi:hypothetical protein
MGDLAAMCGALSMESSFPLDSREAISECPRVPTSDPLSKKLKSVFGYDAFRPLQREIIEASMAGQDTFALLPTGGGKSLCFQLPALMREGLTLVVSPLIALMKDQVSQLEAAGVEATFLNSSLGVKETKERLAGLHKGRFRLLYAAPERLMLDHWKENLLAWNVSSIAIDEAHCISEWGHDFRPEYRQIAKLRGLLPEIPVMALTATATERVRQDIIQHLKLKDPAVFVASFNRPNLSYRVIPKDQPIRQIVEFVRKRPMDGGIVYCATRATADRVAESLTERGFPAVPYHAGMSPYRSIVLFQWSCHKIAFPGAPVEHFEYLNTEPSMPNDRFIAALREVLGSSGTVLTWSSYENTQLRNYLEDLDLDGQTDHGLATWLRSVLKDKDGGWRQIDLHDDVVKKYYYHHRMASRTSIKAVLPAILSEPQPHANVELLKSVGLHKADEGKGLVDPYKLLPGVKDGTQAMTAYDEMLYGLGAKDPNIQSQYADELLAYCKLDTLSMVLIFNYLNN